MTNNITHKEPEPPCIVKLSRKEIRWLIGMMHHTGFDWANGKGRDWPNYSQMQSVCVKLADARRESQSIDKD